MELYTTNADFSHLNMETIDNQRDFDDEDVFYEELRRQVLLLTAEDDEEFQERKAQKPACSLQQRLMNTSPAATVQQDRRFYNWSGDIAIESVPTWIFKLWSTGHGTGVFIPQNVSYKRHRPRRKNNDGGRLYKRVGSVES